MNHLVKTSLVVGLALFAMIFGAGNIIFPPYIGVIAGDSWFIGFLAYFVADIGLAIVAIIALLTSNTLERFESIFYRLGYWTARIFTGGIIISVGYICGPRTATVSYELGFVPVFGDFGLHWYCIVYFVLAWLLTIRESKMIDYIGKYLTPILVVGLLAAIIVGVINPPGEMSSVPKVENVWYMGLMSGYQTMDITAAVIYGYVISQDLSNKGYTSINDKIKAVLLCSVVVGVLMFIVYGGLCYLGATLSQSYGADVQHGALVVAVFQTMLGKVGSMLLGVVVAMACLTTAIAMIGCPATFLVKVSNGKLKYNVMVTLVCFSYALLANLGLARILQIAVPIIVLLFPVLLTMMFLALADRKIKNANIYKIAVGFTLIYAAGDLLRTHGVEAANILEVLPLQEHGFGWILPAAVGAVVGYFVKPKPEEQPA